MSVRIVCETVDPLIFSPIVLSSKPVDEADLRSACFHVRRSILQLGTDHALPNATDDTFEKSAMQSIRLWCICTDLPRQERTS